jgi:hypothetical protein
MVLQQKARFFNLLVTLIMVGSLTIGCSGRIVPEKLPASASEIRIHDVQGCSHQSPYTGSVVEDLSGIVTRKISNGFYLQDDQPDDQFCSSEAIFVFTSNFPDVLPGDRILVTGRVDEYQPGGIESDNLTLTQLVSPEIKLISRGNVLPAASLIGSGGIMVPANVIDDDRFAVYDPPSDGIDFYESLESMLVRIDAGLVVGARNQYNEVVIIPMDSLGENKVSITGALVQQPSDPNPERIILDLNQENRTKIHVGAVLSESVIGIMDYSYGNYKVNVFGIATFSSFEHQVAAIEKTQGALTIATYNVENLSRFDNARLIQLAEDIGTILDHPDLLVLHEILDDSGVEDDGVVSAAISLERLTDLIEMQAGVDYGFIDVAPNNNQDGGIAGGNIRSVMLYRLDTLRLGDPKSVGLPGNPTRIGPDNWPFSSARKPLLALFEFGNTRLLVITPHLTSRGADSPLFGSVQSIAKPEEEKRVAQAAFINEYLRSFHRRNSNIAIVVAGDLNDDPWSKTLQTLNGDLLGDLSVAIPANERFSYILDGNAIQLDYILLSGNTNWSSSIQIVHLNSIFDHTLQMSDHDPVVVQLSIP